MDVPQIGIFWYVPNTKEILGIKQPYYNGADFDSRVVSTLLHSYATWNFCRHHYDGGTDYTFVSLDSGLDYGWVNYLPKLRRSEILISNKDLISDSDFRKKVTQKYQLKESRCDFDFHEPPKFDHLEET